LGVRPQATLLFRSRAGLTGPLPWEVEGRLFSHDQVQGWGFGSAVALDGKTALVGAWGAEIDGASDRGAAYVFVRQGDKWVEQAQLLAFDGNGGDRFGWSVALDGDTAVVGATAVEIEGQNAQGAVYVFQRSGTAWQSAAKLIASDGDANDLLGWSVAIHGETIVAGAINEEGAFEGCQGSGAAYVFSRQGNLWTEEAKLFDPDGQCSDLFGNAVALQGDTVLIGADSASIGGDPNRGAAYVYRWIASEWTFEQKLLASDGLDPDQFGYSVALDRDVALIGARQKAISGSIAQGAAYVFRREGASWTEEQRLTASDGHEHSFFGWSAALVGHLALVGGRLDFPPDELQRGVVWEYRRDEGAWEEVQRFTAPVGEGLDGFGEAMALTHERSVIASRTNDVVEPRGGTAWIFRRPVLFEDGFESGDVSAWSLAVQ
jgi:hypothetical protein